ncbi:hypothetical protein EI555_015694 [Monodon monoceros]|uniref:peptidylprolyl isomerase n=1 Tax=Monodon monoceros TaxID=40151 RepID=A0A4U1EVJ1_MONMO|nr:hypothetical protein EI555_015694 [Monodon monoceros]
MSDKEKLSPIKLQKCEPIVHKHVNNENGKMSFSKKIKEIYDLCLFKPDARNEHVLINSGHMPQRMLHCVNLKEIIDIQYYLWTHNADGTLQDWTVFDTNFETTLKKKKNAKLLSFKVGIDKVIRGWNEALLAMSKVEKARLEIEPEWAYGKKGQLDAKIPPNAKLIFEVELVFGTTGTYFTISKHNPEGQVNKGCSDRDWVNGEGKATVNLGDTNVCKDTSATMKKKAINIYCKIEPPICHAQYQKLTSSCPIFSPLHAPLLWETYESVIIQERKTTNKLKSCLSLYYKLHRAQVMTANINKFHEVIPIMAEVGQKRPLDSKKICDKPEKEMTCKLLTQSQQAGEERKDR